MSVFSAIILAGGRATRMGGQDKGLVMWQGKPLIEHVLARVWPQVDDVVISANRHPDAYGRYAPCYADTLGDFAGPLAGIAACLPHCRHERVLVVACDMLAVPRDLAARLAAGSQDKPLAVAHDGEHLQPLALLLDKGLQGSLLEAVCQGHAAVYRWIREQDHAVVTIAEPGAFLNVNSREELAKLDLPGSF